MNKLPLVLLLLFALPASVAQADPIGDSYTVGITGFGELGGDFLTIQATFTPVTFDGSGMAKVIGDSVYGEQGATPLDEFVISDTLTDLGGNQREIVIDVTARNKSTLLLTNWIADGQTTDGVADVFSETAVEIGAFNGGTDRINISSLISFDSSEFRLIGTDNNTYGSFAIDAPDVGGQLGGAAGIFLGSGVDIATFEIASGVEIAGYQMRYVYTVPEPGSSLLLAGLAVGYLTCRRKSTI